MNIIHWYDYISETDFYVSIIEQNYSYIAYYILTNQVQFYEDYINVINYYSAQNFYSRY